MLKYQQKIKELIMENLHVSEVTLTIPPDSRLGDVCLILIDAVKQVIKNCLWILGIDTVEVM